MSEAGIFAQSGERFRVDGRAGCGEQRMHGRAIATRDLPDDDDRTFEGVEERGDLSRNFFWRLGSRRRGRKGKT